LFSKALRADSPQPVNAIILKLLTRKTHFEKHPSAGSFYRKIVVSLCVSAIIPILFVVYLLYYDKITTGISVMFGATVITGCILLGFILLFRSADQLKYLAKETKDAGKGPEYSVIKIEADEELNDIAENFNQLMGHLVEAKKALRNQSVQLIEYAQDLAQSYRKIDQEEELRNNLCRYISSDLVGQMLEADNGNFLSNQRKPITVLFADIRSFTALAEYMEPEDVVTMLNEYFSIMVDIVFQYDGMLDKLVGDQLMAVFGHISNEAQGANDAVNAAVEMQKAAEKLMEKRSAANDPTFEIGIGINTGNALFAHVGSENRMDYTVIGDTVNAASRLEQYAKGGEIIIGDKTKENLADGFYLGERFELKVRNRETPMASYRVSCDSTLV
jgi:adenylate cyclase